MPQSSGEAKQQQPISAYLAEAWAGPKHPDLSQEDPRGNRGAKKVLYRRIFRMQGLMTELVDHLIPSAILKQAIHFISKQVLVKP